MVAFVVFSFTANWSAVQPRSGRARRHSTKRRYGTLSCTLLAAVFGSYPLGRYPICERKAVATSSMSFRGVRGVLLTTFSEKPTAVPSQRPYPRAEDEGSGARSRGEAATRRVRSGAAGGPS